MNNESQSKNIGQKIGQGVKRMRVIDQLKKKYGQARVGEAVYLGEISPEAFFKACADPEKIPPLSGPVTMEDGMVLVPKPKRGSVLQEAITTINGERQDVYGSPEDSFALIGEYWGVYLRSQGYIIPNKRSDVEKDEVAMMMNLFKVAREANQHKRDNIVDAAGYLGIYADMQGAE